MNIGMAGTTGRIDAAPDKLTFLIKDIWSRSWAPRGREKRCNKYMSRSCRTSVKVHCQRWSFEVWSLFQGQTGGEQCIGFSLPTNKTRDVLVLHWSCPLWHQRTERRLEQVESGLLCALKRLPHTNEGNRCILKTALEFMACEMMFD